MFVRYVAVSDAFFWTARMAALVRPTASAVKEDRSGESVAMQRS